VRPEVYIEVIQAGGEVAVIVDGWIRGLYGTVEEAVSALWNAIREGVDAEDTK